MSGKSLDFIWTCLNWGGKKYKDKLGKITKTYYCEKREKDCLAKIVLVNDQLDASKSAFEHPHPVNPSQDQNRQFKADLKAMVDANPTAELSESHASLLTKYPAFSIFSDPLSKTLKPQI